MFRLEQLAQDIESEYTRFDSWRDKCDNMNQWLTESEKLIKNEDKIGSDIEVLQEQIKDSQVGFKSLYHESRKCSQLEAVVYSTVFHPTLSIVRRTYVAFIRNFKKLLRLRRGQRRLKNQFIFCLRISRHS